jgi:ankyrin repeat protein
MTLSPAPAPELIAPSRSQGLADSALAGSTTRLMVVARRGNLAEVQALLPISDPRAANRDGVDALGFAALAGHADCVRALRGHCDPNRRDAEGKDALMMAALSGSVDCVAELLTVCDPRAKTGNGLTALMLASGMGFAPVAHILMERSDLDAMDRLGRNAQGLARMRGHRQLASHLEAFELAQLERRILEAQHGTMRVAKTRAKAL